MSIRRKILNLFILAAFYPLLTGFVLLSNNKASLPVTAESPELAFEWDGNAPSIEKKDEFQDGAYQDMNDEDFMEQLLIAAFGIWNEVPGSFLVLSVNNGDASINEADKKFSIVVESNSNLTTAAFSTPHFDEEDNTIIDDCDISIADKATNARSLAYTIAHEVGHCLGLGHPHTNYNAMMGYARDKKSLRLGADDMAGLMFLYPDPNYFDEGEEPQQLINCATTAATTKNAFPVSIALVFIPLIVFGIFRTRSC